MISQQPIGHAFAHKPATLPLSGFTILPATARDLASINKVVEEAISTWSIAPRTRRLVRPLLTYTDTDFRYMDAVLVRSAAGVTVATAIWESANPSETESGLTLHGIYISPAFQHDGIGTRLVEHVSNVALAMGYNRIDLKAWRDSEEFFLGLGFSDRERTGRELVYPRELWRPARFLGRKDDNP